MTEQQPQPKSVNDMLSDYLKITRIDKERAMDTAVEISRYEYNRFKEQTEIDEATIFSADFVRTGKGNPLEIIFPYEIGFAAIESYDMVMPRPFTQNLSDFMKKNPDEKVCVETKGLELEAPTGERRGILRERYIEPVQYGSNPLTEILIAVRYPSL